VGMGTIAKLLDALPRWMAILIRWIRYAHDLGSPVLSIWRFPKSLIRARASSPKGASVSTAKCEWNKQICIRYTFVFVLLVLPLLSTFRAAAPADWAVDEIYVFSKVSEQVASQRRHLPLDHGINVAPSGRFPLLRIIPEGSRMAGICTVAQLDEWCH
jgi:hypothetical protein